MYLIAVHNNPVFNFCKRNGWFIVFLFLINTSLLFASKDVSISEYTINEGLSGNGITAIYQDSKGYIWVGTHDGLNKFDGYSFVNYRHVHQNPHSIAGNFVRCITEDSNGDIWVGTLNDGLSRWVRKTGKFINYNNRQEGNNHIIENNIYGISFDSDSSLWMKSDNYLIHLNIKNKEVNNYGLYSSVFASVNQEPSPICHISSSILWLATQEGISQFNKDLNLYQRITSKDLSTSIQSIGNVYSIKHSDVGGLLIASETGVYHFLSNEDNFYRRKIDLPYGPESVVHSLLTMSNGQVWLGTQLGLRLLSKSKESNTYFFNKHNTHNRKNNLLTDNEITCLLEDKSGILWAGTKYNGLLKIDFKPKKFKSISQNYASLDALKSYDIKSINIDKEGRFWLGTGGKGLSVIDLNYNNVYNFIVNDELYRNNQDEVISICEDSKNRVWLGTNQGIYLYSKSQRKVIEFSYAGNSEAESLLRYNKINDILEDSYGHVWFATQFGLYKYDGHKILSYFSDRPDKMSLYSDDIQSLYEDNGGLLWIGTAEGVNYLDLNQNESPARFKSIIAEEKKLSSLKDIYVLSISGDAQQNIWFGTRTGLICYSKVNNTIHHYNQEDGLTNDLIYSVSCGDSSDVWLSTNKGISHLSKSREILNFDISDGLPGYVFNQQATAVSKNGNIYFAGVDGIAYLNPDSLKFNTNKPDVRLSTVALYHKGKRIEFFRNVEDHISIKYKRGSILSVKYAALEYSEPSKNKFQVYLEGFDDDWRSVTSENDIKISNIPSGEYTLWVKGSNNDLVWGDEPAKLTITIAPPIWQSSYAYAFYLIAIVFLLQSLINFRIRNYKKAYRDLEYKTIEKDNVEAQKDLLSTINQSLTDSIHYAKRIQESILPSTKKLSRLLNESFVYFRPKDLVSGDFYWIHEEDNLVYVSAIDCTGHGVPGAFLSLIANNMLKNIVQSNKGVSTGRMLDLLNLEVNNTFKKNNISSQLNVNDGMDLAMCIIDRDKQELTFSGAMNPLYLVRDNEIIAYKGDRLPIGHELDSEQNYSEHKISIFKGDMIYIFSDGYADQFGGDDGKKFKYRRFRHLLLTIHKLPVEDQKAILHQKMEEWMGDFEQVDDIVVMGFRPID